MSRKRTPLEVKREQSKLRQRRHRAAHPEKYRQYWRTRREQQKEKINAFQRARAAANPAKIAAIAAARRAMKDQRTPTWADLKKIEQIYAEAKVMSTMMEEPWHVDHVIPLRGKNVSGLHVHQNLQLLPGAENVRKSNQFFAG